MGLGGKRVAGLGGLGEWVSGGRLTAGGREVAGRACPAPTGGERKIVGVRRGGKAVTGGGGKHAGRACPAPTGVMVVGVVCFQHSAHVNVENACNFYLIIIV